MNSDAYYEAPDEDGALQFEAYERSSWFTDDAYTWLAESGYDDLPANLVRDLFTQYGDPDVYMQYWLEEGAQP